MHESQERHRLALQDLVTLREERDRLAVALKAEHDRWLGMPTEPPVAESIVVEYPRAPRVGGVTAEPATEIVAMLFKVLENPPAEKELPEALWVSFDSLLKAYVAMDHKSKDDIAAARNAALVKRFPEWCQTKVAAALAVSAGTVN
ncbi:MAG: hypothetical protein NTW96_27575 [Planctomycetia bacterium]|nr:hypothetical protein [Planctomycetia bacterium]